jgi:cysteine-rich repeat protein
MSGGVRHGLATRRKAPPLVGVALAAVLSVAIALPARAHDDDHHRLTGDVVKLSSSSTKPSKRRFKFHTKDQLPIGALAVDPSTVPTTLVVRDLGTGAATSGVIRLTPAGWRRAGANGWKYKASPKDPAAKGLKSVVFKAKDGGGSLRIKGGREYWPLAVDEPFDGVEIFLSVDADVYCAEFSAVTRAEFKRNRPGKIDARRSDPPEECGTVCGNGILELGEACDDGNDDNTDTCTTACESCPPEDVFYDSTFAAIQTLIFDSPTYGCSTDVCHGAALSGGLDLRDGAAYDSLVGVASQITPSTLRVNPGDDDSSMLYLKLASKTLGDPDPADLPGSPMPAVPDALLPEHLEAIRLWIRGGASETATVEGTAELFGACLPPASPKKTPKPAAPDPADGTQFTMPPWPLSAQSENQICVATYYDLSAPGLVPADALVDCPGFAPGTNDHGTNAGKCLAYGTQLAVQDGQSHHIQIYVYRGDYDYSDPGWGDYICHGGTEDGQPCDPTDASSCAPGVCGGTVVPLVDCFPPTYGPPDLFIGFTAPLFLASQEPVLDLEVPSGGYGLLPLKGMIVWNSHAFNLTTEDMMMEAWLNELYTPDRTAVASTFFEGDYIYTQDVPPFETREYCATKTFPEGFTVFELLSHVHKRGKRYRIYDAPQTPCGDGGPAPNGSGLATDPACTPGDPADLIYESFDYDDPTHLKYDPPRAFTGTVEERTIKYCALYDNGATDPSEVKRASTSPPLPDPNLPGGPCAPADRKCLGGPNQGQPCYGDDLNCPDSICDACNLRGGITSDDEMFLLVGYALE